MLDIIVRYLHGASVPFTLSSYPSPEAEPQAVHALPPQGMLVDSQLVLVDGRLALACFPVGEQVDLTAIGAELGGLAIEVTTDELPDEFRGAKGTVPPLGQLFGFPIILDEKVSECGVIVFRAFNQSDYFDIPYEDYARLEAPRIASFASAGELGPAPRRGGTRAPA